MIVIGLDSNETKAVRNPKWPRPASRQTGLIHISDYR